MLIAYLVVAVVAGVAAAIDAKVDITVRIDEEFAVFAVLYIIAQAVERLVEPLMGVIKPSDQEKEEVKAARVQTQLAIASAGTVADAAAKESEKQKQFDAVQQERAVIAWALASVFSLLICGALGLGLIESVATIDAEGGDKALFSRIDVIVTGLAVGAGTKPLHDLIARLEKAKEKADPATTAPAAPAQNA